MDSISPDIPQKQCPKCSNSYPATAEFFPITNTGKLAADCNICRKAYRKRYYETHKEHVSEQSKQRYDAHRDEILARQKEYIEAHKDEYLARRMRYKGEYERARSKRRAKLPHYKAYHKQYRESHKEEGNAYTRRYRIVFGKQLNEKKKRYLQTERGRMVGRVHRQRRRAQKKASGTKYTAKQLQEQLKRQKYRCYYCSVKLDTRYHIDHVVPLSRGGSDDLSNLVMACPTCNLRKNNKLPHEWPDGNRLL